MKLQAIIDRVIKLAENRLTSVEVIVGAFLLLFSLAGFIFLGKTYLVNRFATDRIVYGGEITEGLLGNIKTINPLVSQTQAEKDLSQLVFAGLIKKSENGNYILDLASNIVPMQDALSYNVTISPQAIFHDNTKITADDVLFSFQSQSEIRRDFDQIAISKIDDNTLSFKLEKPNNRFLSILDFPIFKKGVTSITQGNFVGSGPFMVKDVAVDESGSATKIVLKSFAKKSPKATFVQTYTLIPFATEEALVQAVKDKKVDFTADIRNNLVKELVMPEITLSTSSMSRSFVIFINQKDENYLKNNPLRHYISESINRESLVDDVFGGLAQPISYVAPLATSTTVTLDNLKKDNLVMENGLLVATSTKSKNDESETKSSDNKEVTATTSSKNVTLNLLTLDTPELIATAEVVKQQLAAAGVVVHVSTLPKDQLENVLKQKDFDLFLFGFYIPSPDVYYNFFHSSQTSYPKLNISGYSSKQVDSLLETIRTDIQKTSTTSTENLTQLSENLEKDMPVILLYSTQLAVLHRKDITLKLPQKLNTLEDRYQFVTDWYLRTEKVFPLFQNSSFIKKIETNL